MATAAPPKIHAADIDIPPPPLPEFYLPKSSTRRDDDEQEVDNETTMRVRRYTVETKDNDTTARPVKLPSAVTKTTDKTMTRVTYADDVRYGPVVRMPPPAGGAADVPPLAIYHICRLCLRPRSARYHREHPIPVNGVPPPPGICRRCRVMTVEEVSKVAEMTKCGESNETQIGLGCIVHEEDRVSNQEYKDLHNGRKFMPPLEHLGLRHDSSSERSTEIREKHKKISYRHVRVRESSMSSSPPRPRTHAESTAQDVIDSVSVKSATTVQSEKARRQSMHSGFREVGEGHITARVVEDALPTKTQLATYAASATSRTPLPGSAEKVITRASAAVSVQQPAQPQWSEAGIRRLARDEVERYRQAERKMEAHRDPYAHCRMLPVERRIERQATEAVVIPWEKHKEEAMIEEVVVVKKQSSQRQPRYSEALESPRKPRSSHETERPEKPQTVERGPTWEDEEVVLKQVRQPRTHTTASGYLSRSGQCAETEKPVVRSSTSKPKCVSEKTTGQWNMPAQNDSQGTRPQDNKATYSAEPRSERSERRKWDLMSDLERPPQPEARRQQASGRRRAERDSSVRREIWLPPGKDYEIIEIIDNYDDESVISSREVKNNRVVSEQSNVVRDARMPAREEAPSIFTKAKKAGSKPGNEEDQSQDQHHASVQPVKSTGRKEEELDIKWRRREAQDQAPRRGPASLSSLGVRNKSARVVDDEPEKSDRNEDDLPKPRPRAFDLRRAAANAQTKPSRGRDEVEYDDKTMHPNAYHDHGAKPGRTEANAGKSARRSEPANGASQKQSRAPQSKREYIYTERIVSPVGTRSRQGTAKSDAEHHYTRTEEIWRNSNGSKASSRGVPLAQSNAPTSSTARPKESEARIAEGSEHSSKVRFAEKVDISPTPPGSDANSEQFRAIEGIARSKGKLRDGESGEDLIAEFERRGRSKTRESRSPHSYAGEQEYYYKRQETVREPSKVDGGRDDDAPTAAWEGGSSKSQHRPLVDAYSESPARERSSRWENEGSGAGPYRPELPRQESMDVLGGSEHTARAEVEGSTEDSRYGHAHGRWPEDLSLPASHVR